MKKREETKMQEVSAKTMEFKAMQAQAESVSFFAFGIVYVCW